MGKYRFGWPDLLLPLGFVPALTGHFYVTMAILAVYAVLYHRATHRAARAVLPAGSTTSGHSRVPRSWARRMPRPTGDQR